MKKHIFIIPILISIMIITTLVIYGKKDKKNESKNIDADIICRISGVDEVDDGSTLSYKVNQYIKLDNEYIKSIKIENIGDVSTKSLMSSYISIFKDIEGINADIKVVNNNLVTTIDYDYQVLNVNNYRSSLGNLIDENSILAFMDLPIKYEDYKTYELKDYTCKNVN